MVTIYCASYGCSGVWAFSPQSVITNAPDDMLKPSEFSSGEVWEANLNDLDDQLWAFSYIG